MSQPFRLPAGGAIDRAAPLRFFFDGRPFTGFAGDTLAAALLANGVRLVGRSFKYHRPRGILSAGPEEPNALVELREGARREPNTRATTTELFEGLRARSQNRFPSLHLDLMGVNQVAAPLFAAGFYYKTFMWPASFWEKVYEPLIRRAAGLGRAAEGADPDEYERANLHCDVLVIGGGPSGLMAALVACRAGARVVLCEEDCRLGGRLLSDRRSIEGQPAANWVRDAEAELRGAPGCRVLTRTGVFGAYDGEYGALERVSDHLPEPPAFAPRQRVWRIVARRHVLAAGSIERPLVFVNNDRPGVMLAGAVRTYLNRFAVLPGRRAVLFTNNDDALRTAADLLEAGATVAAIVDARPEPPAEALRLARLAGAPLLAGGVVTAVRGRHVVRRVEAVDARGRRHRIDCDLLAMSGGWSPTVHLSSHHGHKPRWDEERAAFLPADTLPPGMAVAGAANGALLLSASLEEGARAGAEAASAAGFQTQAPPVPETDGESRAMRPLWRVRGGRGRSFVDFQHDVTGGDLALAHREGFRAVEHAKRYTTLGMATDQGKLSGTAGVALMAELNGTSIAETGTTTFRPPYAPVAIGALAGPHRGRAFQPERRTPTDDWAREQGAVFVEAGLWLRAAWFPRPGEADWFAAATREARTVREAVGLCDVTTLGKIDVQGPDAATLLDRLYCNTMSTLVPGRVRYGVMLREDGVVMDDGTAARLGPEHFLLTTTTVNASRVMQHAEFCLQWLWPELDARVVSVTEQWAQLAVAGPRARDVLRAVVDPPFDLADTAFPFMACAALSVCGGVPARLFRISFSGELGFELAVPARFGDALVRRLMAAGAPHGIAPYGLEALNILRIEKGHAAGAELNGNTTAADLGLERMMARRKDYVGRALAARPGTADPSRPRLVGLRPLDRGTRLRAGAHLVPGKGATATGEGYVTSCAFSPALGHWIGLGLLARGATRLGEVVVAHDPLRGSDAAVEVCSPVHVDPEGVRFRG